jgi:sialic acid synthase
MRKFIINDTYTITDQSPAFVIAEVGSNHDGDYAKAVDLIRQARNCGCHAVKFQKKDIKSLYSREMQDSSYENEFSMGKTYGEHKEKLELSIEDHLGLKELADLSGIIYFATPFDMVSLGELLGIHVGMIKVASGDLTSIPLLRAIGKTTLPVILSTGGGTLEDIDRALQAIGHDNVAILHCVATYPTDALDCNLLCIRTLREKYPNNIIGLSDHYNGILSALIARMFGAGIIEKHFKGGFNPKCQDAVFSLNNHKMVDLLDSLEDMESMMGDGVKKMIKAEKSALKKMGKGIYATQDIQEGEEITLEKVTIMSPSNGIPAARWDEVFGRKALCQIKQGQALDWRMMDGAFVLNPATGTITGKGVI